MNKVFLVGRLTKDPELRTTGGGTNVCSFTLAVDRRFTNQQGVREADFIPIVAWRQTADLCARYLSKGRECAVSGSIQTRSYDAQDGSKRYVTEVVADEVQFIGGSRQDRPYQPNDNAPIPEPAPQRKPDSTNFIEADDDELPF